jgi:Ca-activated chloride channel homolog
MRFSPTIIGTRPGNLTMALTIFSVVTGNLFGQFPQDAQPQMMNHAQTVLTTREFASPSPKAEPFSSNGKTGWKVVIPENRPLATPAVASGRVFIGGGFGSHEVYALDTATGRTNWLYHTGDDGPTAVVYADGYIEFNTESCELEVLTVEGKPVWKKWLGDPLMSMPAIDSGRIYMSYPDSRGDLNHYLGCFDLRNGTQYWKKQIAGEIITAPVIHDGKIFCTTLEGTVYCFTNDGTQLWKDAKNATSSPQVTKGECYFSKRERESAPAGGIIQTEQMSARATQSAEKSRVFKATKRKADYLDYSKRVNSKYEAKLQRHDAAVGFAGSKGDAKMKQGIDNIGQASVAGVWSYQGSRPFEYYGCLYSSMGDTLICAKAENGSVQWKKYLGAGTDSLLLDAVLTPPVLIKGKIFVGSAAGRVWCLSAETAKILWSIDVGGRITFQPAVADGRVYIPTDEGILYCVATGDSTDTGWRMWGGTSKHNGLDNTGGPALPAREAQGITLFLLGSVLLIAIMLGCREIQQLRWGR